MIDKLVVHHKLHVQLNSSFLRRGYEIECLICLFIRKPFFLGFATMSTNRRSKFFTMDQKSIVLNFNFEILWIDLDVRDPDF